jgi:hypothetical protein
MIRPKALVHGDTGGIVAPSDAIDIRRAPGDSPHRVLGPQSENRVRWQLALRETELVFTGYIRELAASR